MLLNCCQLLTTGHLVKVSTGQRFMEMFPTKTQKHIQLVLTGHGNMKDGVLVLTTSVPEENSILASTNLEPKKSTMTLPV